MPVLLGKNTFFPEEQLRILFESLGEEKLSITCSMKYNYKTNKIDYITCKGTRYFFFFFRMTVDITIEVTEIDINKYNSSVNKLIEFVKSNSN